MPRGRPTSGELLKVVRSPSCAALLTGSVALSVRDRCLRHMGRKEGRVSGGKLTWPGSAVAWWLLGRWRAGKGGRGEGAGPEQEVHALHHQVQRGARPLALRAQLSQAAQRVRAPVQLKLVRCGQERNGARVAAARQRRRHALRAHRRRKAAEEARDEARRQAPRARAAWQVRTQSQAQRGSEEQPRRARGCPGCSWQRTACKDRPNTP